MLRSLSFFKDENFAARAMCPIKKFAKSLHPTMYARAITPWCSSCEPYSHHCGVNMWIYEYAMHAHLAHEWPQLSGFMLGHVSDGQLWCLQGQCWMFPWVLKGQCHDIFNLCFFKILAIWAQYSYGFFVI